MYLGTEFLLFEPKPCELLDLCLHQCELLDFSTRQQLFLSRMRDTQYFWLVTMILDIYFGTTLFTICIHLVSMTYNVNTIFMSGIHDSRNLGLDYVSDFIYCGSHPVKFSPIIIIIIIIIKKGQQCKAGREWYTPYQSEDPSPTIPTYRQKEEKESRRL